MGSRESFSKIVAQFRAEQKTTLSVCQFARLGGLASVRAASDGRDRTADMRREQALAEFSRFRVGAIPVLTNLLDDPALAVDATRTMNGIGLEATSI